MITRGVSGIYRFSCCRIQERSVRLSGAGAKASGSTDSVITGSGGVGAGGGGAGRADAGAPGDSVGLALAIQAVLEQASQVVPLAAVVLRLVRYL